MSSTANAPTESASELKKGLWSCWGSLAILPVAALAMTGGPCGGPNGLAGSIVLLGVGLGCLALAGVGIFRVSRGFRVADRDIRAWCVISMICAGAACLVGLFFTFIGAVAIRFS